MKIPEIKKTKKEEIHQRLEVLEEYKLLQATDPQHPPHTYGW